MTLEEAIGIACELIKSMPVSERIAALNKAKIALHHVSPFASEPVDCVIWIPSDAVVANDYNPNSVAPPEMKLLQHSIESDGFTQPIVGWDCKTHVEVVDGFHRNRVGKECDDVRKRLHGHLPVSMIRGERVEKPDRIAATIRHNRARGKHAVSSMSDIVVDLKRRNWSDKKIGKELGMDQDEVLRLSQISGLAEMFSDVQFAEAWESDVILEDDSFESIDEP